MARPALNSRGVLTTPGFDITLAHDIYPEGHQGGLGILLHDRRVATNGDLRLDASPGQWSPIPKVTGHGERDGGLWMTASFPDESRDRKGFNPIIYPDWQIRYEVDVVPIEGGIEVRVHLEEAIPDEAVGPVGFNLEIFPGWYQGLGFLMDGKAGVFPSQANGPCAGGDVLPLAGGSHLVLAPEDPLLRFEVLAGQGFELLDGRGLHNNGWFILRSAIAAGATRDAVVWQIRANPVEGWLRDPVVQVSQVGYHPAQPKVAVVERDPSDARDPVLRLIRLDAQGPTCVLEGQPKAWGEFLRYRYATFDFSAIREPGLYHFGGLGVETSVFRIAEDIYDRHVWQPTVEVFLPVQMCHMRVVENYRVWHGACHLDDARMAPLGHNHFDGYVQGNDAMCSYQSGEIVPGLDCGGWHDAGDYDLRVESQADTILGLALAYEEFGLDLDSTTIDQQKRLVEIHRPDGKPDVLQQVEHGVLTLLGGYRALGRLYRGIIEPTLEQYVHLGDAATQTDNVASEDDRWVFTEDHPGRQLGGASSLAAASRVLRGYDDALSSECLLAAKTLFVVNQERGGDSAYGTALEIWLADADPDCLTFLKTMPERLGDGDRLAWVAARLSLALNDPAFTEQVHEALAPHAQRVREDMAKTPYGVPYEPQIWGAGWAIQGIGCRQYWLCHAFPDLYSAEVVFSSLNFVLGCHPGRNPVSFVSGVGAKSLMPGYGVTRADGGWIAGGSGSGTNLVRPDYPELLPWPYLWQQTEYCLGGPTADYVFLVNAAARLASRS